jgi:phosphonopyruvate decarboxylase
MIKVNSLIDLLKKNNSNFYTGVPDSLLKDICSYISDNAPREKHVISANEGGAVALATGYYLATSKLPLVYMQNSGFGNTINPLLSLADPKV